MAGPSLSPEIVSLIHHVELNKAGWWEKGTQRLILGTLWLSNGCLTHPAILDALKNTFRLQIDSATLNRHIGVLRGADSVVQLTNGQIKLTEKTKAEFEDTIKEAEELEARAKARFIMTLRAECQEVDYERAWSLFLERLLIPLVRQVGAGTYQLLTGTGATFEKVIPFPAFLSSFDQQFRVPVKAAVLSFLDPKDEVTRSYVLRHLNAQFFMAAGNLEASTIQALSQISKTSPSFSIFVDTNFLFSILGLHENPSNEAAELLMRLMSELKGKIRFRLYASLLTLDETKRSLSFHEELLRGIHLVPNLAEAAIEDDLSGIARTYIEKSTKTGQAVSPHDYFAPYLSDLIPIIRAKGVEPYNENMDTLKAKQEVIDDILARQEIEKRVFEQRGRTPKTYEQLEHDIVLWHFAKSKRPAAVESPLAAQFWIVTVDYRLIAFDSSKTGTKNGIPVCLHPSSLIQMLQFWMPRTIEFEEAMLGTLRWPFLLQDFNHESEKVTVRILEVLNRFENVGDLPKEVVGSILMNDVLRQKLELEGDAKERIKLVKEALIQVNQKTQEEVVHLRKQLADKAEALTRTEDRAARTEDELQKESAGRHALELRLAKLESEAQVQEAALAAKKEVRNFLLMTAAIAITLLALGALPAWLLRLKWSFWKLASGFDAIALLAALWTCSWLGSKKPSVQATKTHRLMGRIRGWSSGLLAAAAALFLVDGFTSWLHGLISALFGK